MPAAPSVSTRLAPSAFSTFRRSTDMVSGMVRVMGYPRAAATNARAIPVLPLVGSIISLPGLQDAALLRVPHHGRADPALHRIGRVAAFDLGQDGGLAAIRDAIQTNQRRVADAKGIVFVNSQLKSPN